MKRLANLLSLTAALTMLHASPGRASTMPTLYLEPGQRVVQGGFADASFDAALDDRLSVGGLVAMGGIFGAARATWRFAGGRVVRAAAEDPSPAVPSQPDDQEYTRGWGLTAAAGTTMLDPYFPMGAPAPSLFASTSLMGSLPMPVRRWTGRLLPFDLLFTGALGPAYFLGLARPQYGAFLLLNLEIAVVFDQHSELTLLGNSLVGYRRRF